MTLLAQGASVTAVIRDNSTIAIATNGGLGSFSITPNGGNTSSVNFGPGVWRQVLGNFAEGASVVLTNISCNAFDYEASTGFDPTQVLSLTIAGAPAILTNPTLQATNLADNYTQVSIQNKSATANSSADMVAYPDNVSSSDLTGFMDMGITSSAFAQAAYAITGPNEAYLFGSAPTGAGKTGDMVIATDATGSSNAIWFGTGGFGALANRRAGFSASAFRAYTNGSCSLGLANIGFSKLYLDYTNTGTIGAVTINKPAGRVNIAAAASSVVVTNSVCTAASHVMAMISQNDTTAILKNVVPAAGSFTITLNAAATANCSVDFFIVNAD